ncbi:tetratricopeptide repeat protein [Cerasicoccus frondis]|uniref:tetratricopeptide repeat protein n=1 Tax=Cerasicoccus frondis TaxID=490090 RepID=UPI0028524D05|nr:tetratricopeptide repeat protein [Cerasicoccus frondis]
MQEQKLEQALELIQIERYDYAIELISNVLSQEPNNPRALTLMGLAHFYKKDFITAKNHYESALTLRPNDDDILALLVQTLLALKQYATAIETAHKAIAINPKNLNAWLGLGWAKLYCGQTREARHAVTQAKTLEPDSAKVNLLESSIIASMSAETPLPSELKAIKEGLSKEPNSWLFHYKLGIYYLRKSPDSSKGVNTLKEALRLAPSEARIIRIIRLGFLVRKRWLLNFHMPGLIAISIFRKRFQPKSMIFLGAILAITAYRNEKLATFIGLLSLIMLPTYYVSESLALLAAEKKNQIALGLATWLKPFRVLPNPILYLTIPFLSLVSVILTAIAFNQLPFTVTAPIAGAYAVILIGYYAASALQRTHTNHDL